jgi:hypothetical protein
LDVEKNADIDAKITGKPKGQPIGAALHERG